MQTHFRPLKLGKLSYLKEFSPSKAMGTEIFSDNLIKMPKINLRLKKSNIMLPSFNTDRSNRQNTNQKTFESNRKQTEKNILTLQEYRKSQIKNLKSGKQGVNFSTCSLGSKSATSTNANTDRSEKLNLSGEQVSDQKRIIKKSTGNQVRDKIEKYMAQNLSIEDFNILNFCGEGAFGSVYVAQHKATGSLYALKKILKATVSSDVDKQSLIREIKIHMKLDHPNIIKFYGTFCTDKAIYFVMELCYSGNLYQKMRESGPFAEGEVRSIVRQVCSALDYLHNRNIIHRDIKAENIVVQDKIVKICDFGWASEGEYSRKSLCGTPAYISPEVVQNKLYDKKIDVWSMGVLTFELIFGKIPFDIRAQEDLRKIVEDELTFPYERQLSTECKDFIMRCLQKDSFKRWDTSRLLNHPFLRKE